jgi:hypothetical protein
MRKLALALSLVALAGCGGDNGNGDTGVGDTGAATTDIPLTGTIEDGTTADHDGTSTDDD